MVSGHRSCYATRVRHIALPVILGSVLGAPAIAQEQEAVEPSGRRTINLTVYGEDSCPKAQGDEIVVCARQPESERYRIPKRIRERPVTTGSPGWTNQVASIEEASRQTIPGKSCKGASFFPSGAACLADALRQWLAERRLMRQEATP